MNKNAFDDLTLEEEDEEEESKEQVQGFEEEEKKEDSEEEVEFKYDRALFDPDGLDEDEEVDFDDDWLKLYKILINSVQLKYPSQIYHTFNS